MAQVSEAIQAHIDLMLDIATSQWQSLPEVESEIDSWDLLDQLVFIEEWPLEEMRLEQLERHARDGNLLPEQAARYEALKQLVALHRPIIQRLQNS